MSARRARKPPAPPDELAPALEAALLRHLEDAEAFGDRAEHARAAREYEAAIKLVPWQPLAYINLAVACGETGDEAYIARSVAAMRAGVAGGMADVHPLQLNLAVALSELERDAEAAPHYLAAWRLSPTTPAALARGLSTHLDQCAWRGHERLTAVLASEAEHVGILELSRLGRAALARRAAERRSAAHARDAANANANADGRQRAGPAWRRRASRAPLRVGYLTADLHAEHPIGKVAAPLLREQSRHFGVRLFSTAADRTLSRAIAVADGRGAIAVEEVAPGEATEAYAARLREARLHILIDLNSHTRGGRLDDGAAAGARLDELSGTRGRAARASSTTCPPTARSCRPRSRATTPSASSTSRTSSTRASTASRTGYPRRLRPPASTAARCSRAGTRRKSWAHATGRSG